jgi:hypothetical protein
MAAAADLLAVDTKVVERLSAPAENELQNVVKLFQRKVVRHRNQPGDERADFQQYDPGWSGDHNKMGVLHCERHCVPIRNWTKKI